MNKNIIILTVVILVFAAMQTSSQQKTLKGVSSSITNEIMDFTLVPDGEYKYTAVFEAEGKELSYHTGSVVKDSEAKGSKAREALTDVDPPAHLAYGPYANLKAGNYVAFFRLKLLDEVGEEEEVALIDVTGGKGHTQIQKYNITSNNLILNKYVQVPLAFTHPGGEIETRILWSGIASLRFDNVTIYSVSGSNIPVIVQNVPRITQVEPTGKPNNLPYKKSDRPYKDIFPVSAAPADTVDYINVSASAPDVQLAMQTLQGLINREKPVLYLKTCPQDGFWMDWFKERKFIKNTKKYNDYKQLIAKYKNKIKGVVVTDPALASTKNIATMLAGVDNVIAVSPRLAKQLGLPIVHDLRGRWTNDADAYRWIMDNYWDKMNHNLAACLWPHANGVRDYLVQNKAFIFWIPGPIDGAKKTSAPEEQMKFVEELLGRLPANIPIMGYSYAGLDIGIGEGGGVGLMAEFGKYLVGSVSTANLSLHSGIKVPAFKQKKPHPMPKLKRDKTYITFVISDGDNIPVMTTVNWPQVWKNKKRGDFPVAWTISPASTLLIPGIMDYYYQTSTPNDIFMAAVSGVGYTYPIMYGLRYQPSDRQLVFNEFLEQTRYYMQAMDLVSINPSNVGSKEISRYAEIIPELTSIFADYGCVVKDYSAATGITANNIPVFHAVTSWDPKGTGDQQIDYIVSQIKDIEPDRKPAFMHVFICNWFWDLPMIQKVIDKLGDDYVVVAPDHLAALCKQDMEERKIITHMPSQVIGLDGERVQVTIPIQNVTSKPLNVKAALNEGLSDYNINEEDFTLDPSKESDIIITGMPSSNILNVTLSGSFGEKELTAGIRKINRDSIGESLPEDAMLALLKQFEAEDMPFTTGVKAADNEADGGFVRKATVGKSKPGHLVYGPYINMEPGKYIAVFRIKRLSDNGGNAIEIDASVGGKSVRPAVKEVDTKSFPIGEFVSVPLIFDHPGGLLETRVMWKGNETIAVDSVSLWDIK